jgi:hypothetical protein
MPPRLQAKLHRVERAREHSSSESLSRYADLTAQTLRSNQQPNARLTQLDIRNLPSLIAVENTRHPGLALRQYADTGALLADIASMSDGRFRALTRLADQNGRAVLHHVTIDVDKQPGQAPTLVVLEPSRLNVNTLGPHQQLWADLRRHGIDTSRVAIVEAGAQDSPGDCVMYCLNFAIKAEKNRSTFDGMHRNLADHGTIAPGVGIEEHLRLSRGALADRGVAAAKSELAGMSFAAGPLVLPQDFFKHTSSRTTARTAAQLARQGDEGRAGQESLTDRVSAFTVTRSDGYRSRSYSASIEGFRLQEIARALPDAD